MQGFIPRHCEVSEGQRGNPVELVCDLSCSHEPAKLLLESANIQHLTQGTSGLPRRFAPRNDGERKRLYILQLGRSRN